MNSFDLLKALKNAGYIKYERDKLWWPNAGAFEAVVGAILTQQTKWESVETALKNLRSNSVLSLEKLAEIDAFWLLQLIKPCGFSNQKAIRLIKLSRNILEDFGSFETFKISADKEWLLSQKGLGHESADAILCYACLKPVMVIDSYTNRLLKSFGYEFESYAEAQEWFYDGVLGSWDKVAELYGFEIDELTLWARFHGKIVEFGKEHIKGDIADILDI